MTGGEEEGEDGARVGDEVLEGGGNVTGSKSRSGIGGARRGLRVIRSRVKRRKALREHQFVYPTAMFTEYILQNFQKNYTSPFIPSRYFSAQSHLDHQLSKTNQLESSSGPFIPLIDV